MLDRLLSESSRTPGDRAAGMAARLESLDVFRGLVIVTMTLVNYLAGVRHLPAWLYHVSSDQEGYTVVDLVFPGFLFIVGVAIPLALHRRRARGDSVLQMGGHILARSAALLFLGVIMVNQGMFSAEATGMSRSVWFLLAMLCVIVLWNAYPRAATLVQKQFYLGLRLAAGIGLGVLLLLFRGKTASGEIVWLQHSWWGILGLIGWAYLASCAAFLIFRGQSLALLGVLGLMIALYTGGRHGALDWLGPVQNFVNVGAVFGTTAANVMMGILVGSTFVGPDAAGGHRARLRFFLLFAVGLYVAGALFRPLHGINKNAATEAYALVSGAWCVLGFLVVYLLMDVLNIRRWATGLRLVGQNALLAFILPGVVSNLCGVLGIQKILWPFASGWLGALNAVGLTGFIVFLTWIATRTGVRLKL